MNGLTFSFAGPEEEARIRELLVASGLPDEDVGSHLPHFILATSGALLVGCIGLELAGDSGLLRSLAVSPDFRSKGLGEELCRRIEEYARGHGYRMLYLLTISAAPYFQRRGYEPIDRSLAPQGIRRTEQFRSLCPSSAV